MLKSKQLSVFTIILLLVVAAGALFAASLPEVAPFPAPITNSAVTGLKMKGQWFLFSLMGMGAKKAWDDVSNSTYGVSIEGGDWTALRSVPGAAGRLGASAAGLDGRIFLLGGYVLDSRGGELTVPDNNILEISESQWGRGADIPVPVADAVSGIYRERYIYLIGGWSKTEAVRNVQIYDTEKNTWEQATPMAGTPVFGHAGAVVGDTIIYVDGAHRNPAGDKPRFVVSDECWLGKIDHHDPSKIVWSKLPAHPGDARYRISAGGLEKDDRAYFSGGSASPYNYDGMGYDSKPAEPSPVTFAYNLHTSKWEVINDKTPNPTMDSGALIAAPQALVIIGGMEKGQKVTARVTVLSKQNK